MRFCHAVAFAGAGLAAALPAAAQTLPAPWREAAPGMVAAVPGGDTLTLATGETVRLAGILAPRAADGPDAPRWAEWARARLAERALGRPVRLFVSGPADRHGRLVAFVWQEGAAWLQEAMLQAGAARVYFQAGAIARAREGLAAEAEARQARRGLWIDALYAVKRHDELGAGDAGYRIVEGKVLKAAIAGDTLYLNFERDFRRDFTIGFDRAAQRRFKAAGLDPLAWEGRTIRVRGWIERRGGPYIGASLPEQIEFAQ